MMNLVRGEDDTPPRRKKRNGFNKVLQICIYSSTGGSPHSCASGSGALVRFGPVISIYNFLFVRIRGKPEPLDLNKLQPISLIFHSELRIFIYSEYIGR